MVSMPLNPIPVTVIAVAEASNSRHGTRMLPHTRTSAFVDEPLDSYMNVPIHHKECAGARVCRSIHPHARQWCKLERAERHWH